MSSVVENVLSALGTAGGSAAAGPVDAVGGAVSGVSKLLNGIMDRISPDPAQAAALKLQIAQLDQQGHFKELDNALARDTAQVGLDTVEAQSSRFWNSGWRPAVGWIGAVSLGLVYWPKAIMLSVIWTWQSVAMIHGTADLARLTLPAYPDLGVTDLIGLLSSLLGFAGLRSVDKAKGVAS
jgi:hypothetical protein